MKENATYYITYPSADGFDLTIVWHFNWHAPIEQYINQPNVIVEKMVDGKRIKITK